MGVSYSLEKLALEIGATLHGDGQSQISGVASLDTARNGEISFLTNSKYLKAAALTQASALLCESPLPDSSKAYLTCKNPYAALARLISLFHPPASLSFGVKNASFVHSTAMVDSHACISNGVTLSAGVKVGPRSVLYPGVFIGENGEIGEDCILYPNVTIRENCIIGNRVILQPGVVIGSDGFGFAKDGNNYIKIPQVGNVILEDDVELGSNTCVDRAVLGTTRIGKGSKLDNLIQVGHNVVIGKNTVMAALTAIAGSSTIGNQVVMGGQVAIAGHVKIADNVTLAARTGVMEDIFEEGVYWGSPSVDMSTEMKNVAAYRQLHELLKRIRQLERSLEKLEGIKKNEE